MPPVRRRGSRRFVEDRPVVSMAAFSIDLKMVD
jgi:hypothetical protein